jgi:hypothetical protein
MPLDPIPARLKLLYARDQWHSSRLFTPLTGWHCTFCPNTEGFGALKRAIVTGQYHKASGSYYGGSGEREPSLQVLRGFVDRRFNTKKHSTDQGRRVVVLDVHTGLGTVRVFRQGFTLEAAIGSHTIFSSA